MRILAITHLFPHLENSVHGVFAARQFAALSRCGAEVTVVFARVKVPKILGLIKEQWRGYDHKHEPIPCREFEVIQVPYIRLERGCWSCRWEGLALFHAMKKKILALHRAKPFDVIYGRGLFPCADAASYLSRYLNVPAVGAAIGGDVNIVPYYSSSLFRHYNKLINRLNGVVANGQGLSDKIFAECNRECAVLQGAVDLDVFQPARAKFEMREKLRFHPDAPVLLFAGNLIKNKGVYELLEAFAEARQAVPALQLKICGHGVERPGMEEKIKELRITDSAEMIGTVPPGEMHILMQASDIFVLPTYHEGLPNAVMEAMACGLPVIASAVGGLPDALNDSAGAILIEPRNIEKLSAAVLKISRDKTLREQMGREARATAVRKFGAKANSVKLMEYLEKIILHHKNSSL